MPRLRATSIRRERYPDAPKSAARYYAFDIIDDDGEVMVQLIAEPSSGVFRRYGWEARQTWASEERHGLLRDLHRFDVESKNDAARKIMDMLAKAWVRKMELVARDYHVRKF